MKKAFLICLALGLLTGVAQGRTTTGLMEKDSINYTSKEGTRYKMVVIGDRLPELYVNNKKINREDLNQYDDIIGLLQQKIEDRRHKTKNPRS